jgi:hypothetical protein
MINEELVTRYYQLNQQAKEIDNELKDLKQKFHDYFDTTLGKDSKGESVVGDFMVQRQIRKSESLHEEHTVKVLEELNLAECIQTIQRPDQKKIDAAIALGLLNERDIESCIIRKVSQAIVVKKV